MAVVVALFVIPGIVEELFFRGFLFSALMARVSAGATIVISALLFGAFHLVGLNGISLERGVSSTLLGLLLGWVCWRTGSVLPGMLLHGCHNGLLILLTYNQTNEAAVSEPDHLPWQLLAGAAVILPIGLALIQFFSKPSEAPREEE